MFLSYKSIKVKSKYCICQNAPLKENRKNYRAVRAEPIVDLRRLCGGSASRTSRCPSLLISRVVIHLYCHNVRARSSSVNAVDSYQQMFSFWVDFYIKTV